MDNIDVARFTKDEATACSMLPASAFFVLLGYAFNAILLLF